MGFGLPGMWWVISITASVRGLWVFVWFLLYARNKPVEDVPPHAAAERSLERCAERSHPAIGLIHKYLPQVR